MDDPKKKQAMQLEITADDETAQGVYANFVVGNFTETEMVLDFLFIHPQTQKGKMRSRVILSPIHAKRMANMLTRQIKAFEERFGAIPERRPVRMPPPNGSDDTLN